MNTDAPRFSAVPTHHDETYIIDDADGSTWCVCVGKDHAAKAERTALALNAGEKEQE